MAAPGGSGSGHALHPDGPRTPRALLLVPYLLIFVTAALTPEREFFTNQGDVRLYLEKAAALAAGQLPYRDFSLEYPPLALVPMAVPYFVWPFGGITLDVYRWLFAGWEAVLMLALGFVLLRIVRFGGDRGVDGVVDRVVDRVDLAIGRAVGVAGGGARDRDGSDGWGGARGSLDARLRNTALRLIPLSIGAALALTWRFDLFPALLVMVGLWAALDGRAGLAGVVIGLAALAKLYPLAVVPALAIPWLFPLDVRRLARYGAAVALTVVGVMLPFWLLAGGDAFAFLAYQAERGLQIESIGGGLAVLGGLLVGQPPELNHRFSSVQVEGGFADAWLAVLPLLTAAGFGALGLLGWRRIRAEVAADGAVSASTVVAIAGAAVLVLIATNKVFSIQYVVWIVPFAALLRGGRYWLALVVVALTMPIHPLLYEGLVGQEAASILVLNLRNALFVALLAWTLWGIARDVGGRVGGVARPAGLEPTTFRSAT